MSFEGIDQFLQTRTQNPLICTWESGSIREYSRQEFSEDVHAASTYFRGISQKRIAIAATNSYPWLVASFAILMAGKTLIMMDMNLNDHDFIQLARYSDAEMILLDSDLVEEFDFLPAEITVASIDSCLTDKDSDGFEDHTHEAAFICFTSGTSKSSKGVVIAAESLVKIAQLAAGPQPGVRGERIFLPLPLFHIYAFSSVFTIMEKGAVLCLGSGARRFKEEITGLEPDVAYLVPSMLRFLVERRISVPSLHSVTSGGSSCPPEISAAATEAGYNYLNLYGSSETLGCIATGIPGMESIWLKPVPGVRFLLQDTGELGIELPVHMQEYYKKPAETKDVLDGDIYWTGDSAELTEGGYAHILGRMRDTIVLENGEKIHAEDKDQEISLLPHIVEAAVFAGTEGIEAVIVPDDPENWKDICKALDRYNRKYAAYHKIKKYRMHEGSLPRTATGKLRRFVLEKQYKNI